MDVDCRQASASQEGRSRGWMSTVGKLLLARKVHVGVEGGRRL